MGCAAQRYISWPRILDIERIASVTSTIIARSILLPPQHWLNSSFQYFVFEPFTTLYTLASFTSRTP